MGTPVIWILFIAVPLAALFASRSRRRKNQKTMARLRSEWGQRRERERDMESIAGYERARRSGSPEPAAIDDRTWDDLNMDAVFAIVDRTESRLGEQILYRRLRGSAPGNLEAFEALVERMGAEDEPRVRAQLALRDLRNGDAYDLWWLADPDVLEKDPWKRIHRGLAAAVLGSLALSPVWPPFLVVALFGFIVNIFVRATSQSRVVWILPPFRQVFGVLRTARRLRFLVSTPDDPLVGALATELPRLRRLERISRWISQDPLSMGELSGALWLFLNLMFLIDLNAIAMATDEVARHAAPLFDVIDGIGEIDAAIAVASFRAGTRGWTRPDFVPPASPATLSDVRHPLLEHAVGNSIVLDEPHGILVTGSNMAGKTTFLRTVGVNVILAQTIHTCLAEALRVPRYVVRSFIGRADDLEGGKSYYLAEVEAVLERITEGRSPTPHLFLFDELFRGTNAVERIAAAEAVLRELVQRGESVSPHVVLAAVHDLELVDLLRDAYAPFHFGDLLGTGGLEFDYVLRRGPTSSRNAIALLRANGAPESVVERATARASELDRQREPGPDADPL